MAAAPPTLDALNAMDRAGFVAALGDVFEHAAWVAEGAWPRRPFASLDALHRAMLDVLATADPATITAFLDGHPDLAATAHRPAPLTEASAREQAGAGLDTLGADDAARLERLNALYRERFGFPFIVCVAKRDSFGAILAEFGRRLAADPADERLTALQEIADITRLRLDRRLGSSDLAQSPSPSSG
jgi:OHCU decarboxylase